MRVVESKEVEATKQPGKGEDREQRGRIHILHRHFRLSMTIWDVARR